MSADFTLSWSHNLFLIRTVNKDEWDFYEQEAIQEQWSLREMKRQFGYVLYEHLALSRDKKAIGKLPRQGIIVEKSEDIVKDSHVLEFLGLSEKSRNSESTLEQRIIDKSRSFTCSYP